MPGKTASERRQALRAKRILSIQYRLAKSKNKNIDTRWYVSTTHDMSLLGISFLSEIPYSINDILELQVVMSGVVDIFNGYGKVVRAEKKKMGALYLIAVQLVNYSPRKKTAAKKTSLKKKPVTKKSVKKK